MMPKRDDAFYWAIKPKHQIIISKPLAEKVLKSHCQRKPGNIEKSRKMGDGGFSSYFCCEIPLPN